MQPEIMRWTHPDRSQSTASGHPLTGIEALGLVKKQHPELRPLSATLFRDVWMVKASPDNGVVNTAYVDPGTGTITAVGPDSPWIMRWLLNLHKCPFSCKNYPWYASWMTTPVIGAVTVDELITGSIGLRARRLCVVAVAPHG